MGARKTYLLLQFSTKTLNLSVATLKHSMKRLTTQNTQFCPQTRMGWNLMARRPLLWIWLRPILFKARANPSDMHRSLSLLTRCEGSAATTERPPSVSSSHPARKCFRGGQARTARSRPSIDRQKQTALQQREAVRPPSRGLLCSLTLQCLPWTPDLSYRKTPPSWEELGGAASKDVQSASQGGHRAAMPHRLRVPSQVYTHCIY